MMKTKDVHSKILGFIDNKDIKDIIEWAINICKYIFLVMVIILLGFMFIPSAKWGWLDRNTMISSVSTLIGGLFGLIAGIIGIVSTYGAFYIGVKTEKEQVDKEKKEQVKFELSVLQKLLEHTLDETSLVASVLVETYVEFYKEHKIEQILYYRCYSCELVFEWMIEEILTEDRIKSNIIRAKNYYKEFSTEEFKSTEKFKSSELYKNVINIDDEKLFSLYYKIQEHFNEHSNFKRLVYTDEWSKYMLHLKYCEKYNNTCIKDIINWITFLQVNRLEEDRNRIHKLEEDIALLRGNPSMDVLFKIHVLEEEIIHIKQGQLTTIMKFIEYRNNIIDVLETMFDDYEVENDILSSDEEIKHMINYKEWEKKMKLDENERIKD